ncbi:hypothetical protein HPP92_009000 [Vanilla planifolia]|uniref:Uncharacterized protein n=1 Tax=Vanilla planifolia TaxID=51239 RepID=A0A835R7E2_VANPL|nr:hypothetical protein HPP92_009000 [Vanilla planifolia]
MCPDRPDDTLMQVVSELKSTFDVIEKRYVPWVDRIPLSKGMRWIPSWKKARAMKECQQSLFPALKWELGAYGSLHQLEHATGTLFSSGLPWRERIRFTLDPKNTESIRIWSLLTTAKAGTFRPASNTISQTL